MAKKIWQKFGELTNEEAVKKIAEDEFKEELPFEDIDGGVMDAATPRRDFLKYLGFSTAAAAIAAGCKMPSRKVVPFANKPADVIPGVSKYYATTYVQDGDVLPVIAKVRDGRPIKIEGNDLCSFTKEEHHQGPRLLFLIFMICIGCLIQKEKWEINLKRSPHLNSLIKWSVMQWLA